jgi:sterol 3beta-glucosyltransferase
VAHMADQFFWGAELERLGVAGPTRHRKGLAAAKLAQSVRIVFSSPDMQTRAARLGAVMSRENGIQTAVALIEARLRRTRLAAK